jgi:hypothetical protein
VSAPPGADASNVTRKLIPYWRVALQHQFGRTYAMLGTYGLTARLYPSGITGPTDRYADVAADAQIEHPLHRGVIILRSTYIHEAQTLDALVAADTPGAANLHNRLEVFRANASFMPSTRANFTVGYFATSGTRDALLYPATPVSGSANGSPRSNGGIGEFDFNPWQNTRLGVQYTFYGQFNGGSRSYDAAGRNAKDNDTTYFFVWLAF